jgi:FKBP-type peptidyl-prolyl cis-trans isomerase
MHATHGTGYSNRRNGCKENIMKKVMGLLLALGLIACSGGDPHKIDSLATLDDSVSYAIGINIGNVYNTRGVTVNPEIMHRGFIDGYRAEDGLMPEADWRRVLTAYQTRHRQEQVAENKRIAEVNQEAGRIFLEENAKAEGIIVTDSGLQYRILEEGVGSKPLSGDNVRVHYKGMFLDGTVFDSTYEKGEPAILSLRSVIKGWQEALQMMKVGAKWELFVPSNIAYGPKGSGGKIKPNTTLHFEVELLGIAP